MVECEMCRMERVACGQAFTKYQCGMCLSTDMHHNTNVPKMCKRCSEVKNVCQRCGKPFETRLQEIVRDKIEKGEKK